VFLLIIAWAFIESFETLYNGLAVLGWQLTVLIVVLFSLGYGIGWMFTLSPTQRTTLALETGVQNSGLGLAAATMLSSEASGFPVSAIPSVVYSALVYLLVFPFTIWPLRRQNRPAVPPPMD
jgi:BASS family bile acid:Na+ symporter